ncbi:unnamed protein product, partial [Amoebophrya sp. A25]
LKNIHAISPGSMILAIFTAREKKGARTPTPLHPQGGPPSLLPIYLYMCIYLYNFKENQFPTTYLQISR